jgi:hypothetical protein
MSVLVAMLACMCLMHVYWSFMFVKIVVNGLISGNTDDQMSKVTVNKTLK